MNHELYDIWYDVRPLHPWRLQLIDYVGGFMSEASAQLYRDAVKKHREEADKTPKPVKKEKK
jgi:hypothetical protein